MHSTATIRGDLADAVREYSASLNGQFMGLDILPLLDVTEKSGTFGKIAISQATKRVSGLKRAPTTAYKRTEHQVTTDTYTCEEYGLEEPVDDSQARDLDKYFDCEVEAAQLVELNLRREQEVRIAAAVFNATTFTSYTGNVGTEWSAAAGTPYADVQDTILTLKQNLGGVIPAGAEICLAVSEKVYRNVVQTTEIKGMRGGGNGAKRSDFQRPPDAQELASILGVSQVFYSSAQVDGADIWDDEYAMLFLRYSGQSLKSVPHLGRTFMWVDDCPEAALVETYREEQTRSDIVRVRQHVDEKLLVTAAGYLLANITA